MHIINGVGNQASFQAWQAIRKWYGSVSTSCTIINHYRNKLEELWLDESTNALQYINNFIVCSQKLKDCNKGYTTETKHQRFIEQIVNADYNVVKQQLQGDPSIPFALCMECIQSWEQTLLKLSHESTKQAHRFVAPDFNCNTTGEVFQIPSIPNFLLHTIKPMSARHDLIKWQGIYNLEQCMIRPNELMPQDNNQSTTASKRLQENWQNNTWPNGCNRNSKQNKFQKSTQVGKPKHNVSISRQVTCTVGSGLPSSLVRVNMKDATDFAQSKDNDGNSVMSVNDEAVEGSGQCPKPVQHHSFTRTSWRGPVLRCGRTSWTHSRVIFNPGTELDVISGIGWRILDWIVGHNAVLGSVLAGLGQKTLSLVNAITCYNNSIIGLTLIGIGSAGYNQRKVQTKSLVNFHDLCKHGIMVHDTTQWDSGLQRLEIEGIVIDLDFVDNKTLLFYHCTPSDREMETLPIHWMSPQHLGKTPTFFHWSACRSPVPTPSSALLWDNCLGASPEMIMAKMLKATTQLCTTPVEMDAQHSPQQHQKQCLQALHPWRIEWQLDSDMFFSSVKSICNFACMQIFYCLVSKYTYMTFLQRKLQLHHALQDFIRNVGAPNVLLIDNAQTQTGTKWTQTCCEYVICQIHLMPHNQKQNHSERRIQDLKYWTVLVLCRYLAPVEFWCDALQFVTECLNHSAHKLLDWRTPMERLYGYTPNISLFWFCFWQPVWYFEPTAKFPRPTFLLGHFVSIAWEHGDSFTYCIWTEPTDNKSRGQKLICNVVQACLDPTTSSPEDSSQVTFDFLHADGLPCRSISTPHPCPCDDCPTSSTNGPSPKRVHFNDEPVFHCHDSLLQGSGCQESTITLGNETHEAKPNTRDPEEEETDRQEPQATVDNHKWSHIEMGNKVNDNILGTPDHCWNRSLVTDIMDHKWENGKLFL